MKKTEIHIITHPAHSVTRNIVTTLSQVGVIGIGVAVGSTAMQWSGFIALLIILLALGSSMVRNNSNLTIEQARKRLDELERGDL